ELDVDIHQQSIIKGDANSNSIAAASIIAKVYRDRLMNEHSNEYPEYEFEKNSGYGTKSHLDALNKYGRSEEHTSELQSRFDLVCRLLLEKKKNKIKNTKKKEHINRLPNIITH